MDKMPLLPEDLSKTLTNYKAAIPRCAGHKWVPDIWLKINDVEAIANVWLRCDRLKEFGFIVETEPTGYPLAKNYKIIRPDGKGAEESEDAASLDMSTEKYKNEEVSLRDLEL